MARRLPHPLNIASTVCMCANVYRRESKSVFPADCSLSLSVCVRACVCMCVVIIIIQSAPSSEWPDSLRLRQEGSSTHSRPIPLTPACFSLDPGQHRPNIHSS